MLEERDLIPARQAFRLEPFMTVRIAYGGPSAAVDRPIYRVEPLDPDACDRVGRITNQATGSR